VTCIAVFSNVAGIGNTTLVYHLGHMLAAMGQRIVLVDLDPQASLTSLCLPEERIEALWQGEPDLHPTIVMVPEAGFHLETLLPGLALVPGDPSLATKDDTLATSWSDGVLPKNGRIPITSHLALWLSATQENHHADFMLLDLGPNLGAINRAALLAADYLLTPLAPSLQSIAGLQVLGSEFNRWSAQWQPLNAEVQYHPEFPKLLGYVVTQTGMRLANPVPSYARWLARLPGAYRQAFQQHGGGYPASPASDPECLGLIHHYAGLMPLALDARKPMFALRPADGAIGSHMDSVQRCREDYERLANQILTRTADG